MTIVELLNGGVGADQLVERKSWNKHKQIGDYWRFLRMSGLGHRLYHVKAIDRLGTPVPDLEEEDDHFSLSPQDLIGDDWRIVRRLVKRRFYVPKRVLTKYARPYSLEAADMIKIDCEMEEE